MSTQPQIKKGKILIAEPVLGDSSFERSVVILTTHNTSGTVGFILNKPLSHQVSDLLLEFPEFDAPVYYGGPVESHSIYYLHTCPDLLPGSHYISGDLYWGGDLEAVMDKIRNGEINSDHIRFYLGYSGWDMDQLECEIEEKSWIVESHETINPLAEVDQMWQNCIKGLGGDYLIWANSPSDPILN